MYNVINVGIGLPSCLSFIKSLRSSKLEPTMFSTAHLFLFVLRSRRTLAIIMYAFTFKEYTRYCSQL